MNEVLKNIIERRSIRKFKSTPVARELLEEIARAGLYAASAMGGQRSVIVEVSNRELRDRISEMNRRIGGWQQGFDPFYGAPAMLIVLAEKDCANRVYDGSLVMGNLMLAAHSLGLGSCWIHRAKEEFETSEGREILRSIGIEGEYEGIGHCAIGYVDGEYPQVPPRKPNRFFSAR